MAKVGRPKRIWTEEQRAKIDEMALRNCHMDTIALVLEVPLESLRRDFGGIISKKRAEGRDRLRSYQVAMSEKTPAMAIFLGKNELGQADKREIKHGITKETADLLGLIDGSTKGQLPDAEEEENAGQ